MMPNQYGGDFISLPSLCWCFYCCNVREYLLVLVFRVPVLGFCVFTLECCGVVLAVAPGIHQQCIIGNIKWCQESNLWFWRIHLAVKV